MNFESKGNQSSAPYASFDHWIGGRNLPSWSTNAGAEPLAFQGWRHFKEAYAPELVRRAIAESQVKVRHCLDPFGGSGTTALACQFSGVRPTTIEVNPYLADLIEAKLVPYNAREIARDYALLVRKANAKRPDPHKIFSAAPRTFVEPGVQERWIFDHEVASRLAAYLVALKHIVDPNNQRLLRVILGGVLIETSNVIVSGKGRRYRTGWQGRRHTASDLDEAFAEALERAVGDIVRYANRREQSYKVLRGDARRLLARVGPIDLAVFSPPYPNSFDYTDVYNVELWGLGYLDSSVSNASLRQSTLSSHVQLARRFAPAPAGSSLLDETLSALGEVRSKLWDRRIPEMVAGYFQDLIRVVRQVARRLPQSGQIWLVVGDSGYAGVRIPVSEILTQLVMHVECDVLLQEPFRSMRASAQQGREFSLAETLLVLNRR